MLDINSRNLTTEQAMELKGFNSIQDFMSSQSFAPAAGGKGGGGGGGGAAEEFGQQQATLLTVLLCLAAALAVLAALALAKSTKSRHCSSTATRAAEVTAAAASAAITPECLSAPVTRQQSFAMFSSSKARSASSETLQLDCRNQGVDAYEGDFPRDTAAADILDEVELKFSTKLGLLEGVLYLHSFRLKLRTIGGDLTRQLRGARAAIVVRDGYGTGGSQRWCMEADLRAARSGSAGALSTGAIDYVASLRLHGSCRAQLPHEHRLGISAFIIIRPSPATSGEAARGGERAVVNIGELQGFPVHLVNEPSMEFRIAVSLRTGDLPVVAPGTWRQLRPIPVELQEAPRLHLGLQFSPGASVTIVSIRLVEVFDFFDDVPEGCQSVTAAIATLTGAPAETASAATLTALPAGAGAFAFDRRGPVVALAIDNRQLQAAGVSVTITADTGAAGSGRTTAMQVQLGDFAKASGPSAMRQWNAALNNPNVWLWLTHACR